MELLCALPLAELSWNSGRLDDLDAVMTDPVARSHFSVHLFYTTIQCGITVLLVHVMIPSPTLVAQPNTIVLDFCWVFLKNLREGTPKLNNKVPIYVNG